MSQGGDQPQQQVFLARDIPIRRFNGYGEDVERALDFEEEVRRAWNAQPGMTDKRKFDLVIQNVGPIVKDELSCQGVKDDPEAALKIIQTVFGERRSPAQLQDALRQTRQITGETVRLFSHRCRAAFNALTKRQKALNLAEEPENTLRDHFVDNVKCSTLSRYLSIFL